jgi:hypothetical protein
MSSVVLFALTLFIGIHYTNVWGNTSVWRILSLIGTSILLGAQPAAVTSLALGFHPFMGAVLSILANLIPVPILMLAFNEIIDHWKWLNHKVKRIQQWSRKFGHHGVGLVSILSPFIGSYVCIAIGDGLDWNPMTTLVATFSTTILSVFVITYGEQWLIAFFGH